MFIIGLLFMNLLLASADQAKHNGHCDRDKETCKGKNFGESYEYETKKLLFYDVNPPEGFNLRRDVYMRFAITLAEAQSRGEMLDWHLVLPPWHNMHHWSKRSFVDTPKPWSMFFNISALSSFVNVLEMHQVMQDSGRYGLRIDTLYVLQNYDEPFENGIFKEKWEVVGPCKYDGDFWGYQSTSPKRVICVQFQGSISQIWHVINTNADDKNIMFAHGEIPLHASYGTQTFWNCRKSMQFNDNLIAAADAYIRQDLNCQTTKCTNYLAIHWRRQDFHRSNRSSSVDGTARQVNRTVKQKSLDIKQIFVASDGSFDELQLLKGDLELFGYTTHFYLPNIGKYGDGQIAIIEQIICSRSAYFIGTHESTFSYRIQEEREILGFNSDTTFNSLCLEIGECEQPARWTIVN